MIFHNKNKSANRKVVLFSPGYFYSREQLFLYLSNHLDFKVIDFSNDKSHPKYSIPSNVYLEKNDVLDFRFPKLSRLSLIQIVQLFFIVFKILKKEKCKLLICSTQFPLYSLYAYLLRCLFRYKLGYVIEVWNDDKKHSRTVNVYHKIVDFFFVRADYYLPCGLNSRNYIIRKYNVDPLKCFLWPLTSEDMSKKETAISKDFDLKIKKEKRNIIFCYIGRFDKNKGISDTRYSRPNSLILDFVLG